MTATRVDEFGVVRCASGEPGHKILLLRTTETHELRAGCTHCQDVKWDVLASIAWYDSHENLSLLLDWLGDMSPSGFRDVIEEPWDYETEFRAAVAARDHAASNDGHEVLKDGSSDTDGYCDFEGCDWRVVDGAVQELVESCTP